VYALAAVCISKVGAVQHDVPAAPVTHCAVATCGGGSHGVTHSNALLNAPCRGRSCAGSAADSLSLITARRMTGSK
jgi:hypothetical protein